jgi:TIGR03009 family protein
MRHCLLVAGLFLIGGSGLGQAPQQQPPASTPALDPQNNRLDAMLLEWEARMKGIESLKAKIVLQTEDKAFRTRDTFEGIAKYKKPNLAILDLSMQNRPDKIEKLICTGTFVYRYAPESREIRVYDLTPKAGQVSEDNFLSFLFEIKAAEAKRRYEVSFFNETDKNYFILKILPRYAADKAEFQVAYLALSRTTLLPRTLIMDDPKGNRTQWDIPIIESGANLDRREFTAPALPSGWTFRRMPREANAQSARPEDLPPRVARPKP